MKYLSEILGIFSPPKKIFYGIFESIRFNSFKVDGCLHVNKGVSFFFPSLKVVHSFAYRDLICRFMAGLIQLITLRLPPVYAGCINVLIHLNLNCIFQQSINLLLVLDNNVAMETLVWPSSCQWIDIFREKFNEITQRAGKAPVTGEFGSLKFVWLGNEQRRHKREKPTKMNN